MKRTRRNHGASFESQVALAAVKGDETLAEWKQQLLARAVGVFGRFKPTTEMPDLKTLHSKIGQLALENVFLEGALTKPGLLSAKR